MEKTKIAPLETSGIYLIMDGNRMHIAKQERKHACLLTTHDAKVQKAEELLRAELGVE